MPNFFIANCQSQNTIINFRLPESAKVHQYSIQMGKQMPIGPSSGLNQKEKDAIVEQLQPFGLLGLDQLNNMHGKVPYIYSEAPIRSEVILRVLTHNRGELKEGGQKRRQNAAIAANQQIDALTESSGVDPIRAFEMSVEEESQGSFAGGDDKPIAEGVRVSTETNPNRPPRGGSRNRKH
jgi:hypothetical protein